MRFALFLFAMFVFAAGLRPLVNSFARTAADPKSVQISELDAHEADQLFAEFLKHKEIPFRYPVEGCYSRSDAMARIAEAKKIYMGKAVAEGELYARTDNPLYPMVHWGWHIAPVVYVKQPGGTSRLMVFDPSLFKKPATVEEWKKAMTASTPDDEGKVTALYFGNRYQYDLRKNQGTMTYWPPNIVKFDEEKMAEYLKYQDASKPDPDSTPIPFPPSRPRNSFLIPNGGFQQVSPEGTR